MKTDSQSVENRVNDQQFYNEQSMNILQHSKNDLLDRYNESLLNLKIKNNEVQVCIL